MHASEIGRFQARVECGARRTVDVERHPAEDAVDDAVETVEPLAGLRGSQ
jgi:hypothetical protein